MKVKEIAKHICLDRKSPQTYNNIGEGIPNQDGVLRFIDNGADWLAVGHLDNVMYEKPKFTKYGIQDCPQLDDRLGVAIILEILPQMGLRPDILLSDCEEIGRSTAQHFKGITGKKYRYMVEFDRRGSDAVFYQYQDGELEKSFKYAGWSTYRGSNSDIAYLEHLGCEGVNVGCGYHNEHHKDCFVNYAELETQLTRFAVWYKHFGGDTYKYTPKPKPTYPIYSSTKWKGTANSDIIPGDSAAREAGFKDIDDMLKQLKLASREAGRTLLTQDKIYYGGYH